MQPVLSPAACHFLRQLQPKVAAQGRVKKATSQKAVQEVLSWCVAQQLPDVAGNCLQLPVFYFSPQLLKQIAKIQQQLGQPDFRNDYKELQRIDAALASNIEQKSIGVKPRDLRVLVRLLQEEPLANGLLAQVLDIDWQQLPLAQFDALLVVENLDCFYQLERFNLALPYQQPLLVYRGDTLCSKGCKALKTACLQQNKPILYFGDFDAKGVSIALNEGYSAMLLPDIATLQQQASPAMLPDQQLQFIAGIKTKSVSHEFLTYLQLLCEQLTGFRQQSMQGMLLKPILTR
ncbi:hypothetical protein WG68_15965 [Arsukibacterium ikkense]|uniref:DUF7281 domain-containing protein n=1 Tax=Arsukibacterium ikkense TaxID=336831 RepID=A0A0M2V593_9GAMM|nr:Wadjet anti-phage system protein JetD domain-containing protein [Arsukibacterium ikkense]KKO44323.1 hypothetical protein WG68_15965 [Arsukibacterium ikkense]